MADYIYRISASGTAAGANAGFTSLAAAVADFRTNDRFGLGVGVVGGNNIYYKADGFIDAGGADLYGHNVSGGGKVYVENLLGPFNAIVATLGYTNTKDGFNFGGSASFNAGTSSNRQAGLTIRNLVLTGSLGTYGVVEAYGPADGTSNVKIQNCVIRAAHASAAVGVKLDAADLIQCVIVMPSPSGGTFIINAGRTGGNNVDHCTFAPLGGSATWFVYNQNDPPPRVRNSYVGPVSSGLLGGGGTWPAGTTGNAIAGASGWVAGTLYGVALDTTNFGNVTSGSEDLRVKNTSVLVTTGATRLSTVLTDIFGTSRADPATIGAYEYTAPAVALGGGITLDDAGVSGGFGMVASNVLSGAITLDDALPGGGFSIGVAVSGAVTLDDALPGGGFTVVPGTITTPVLKNNAGMILANETGVVVNVYNVATGALIVRKTGQTSSAGGIVTVTDALIVAGTTYAYEVVLTSNGRRLPVAVAA